MNQTKGEANFDKLTVNLPVVMGNILPVNEPLNKNLS